MSGSLHPERVLVANAKVRGTLFKFWDIPPSKDSSRGRGIATDDYTSLLESDELHASLHPYLVSCLDQGR